jgi:hypothetical protein
VSAANGIFAEAFLHAIHGALEGFFLSILGVFEEIGLARLVGAELGDAHTQEAYGDVFPIHVAQEAMSGLVDLRFVIARTRERVAAREGMETPVANLELNDAPQEIVLTQAGRDLLAEMDERGLELGQPDAIAGESGLVADALVSFARAQRTVLARMHHVMKGETTLAETTLELGARERCQVGHGV